MSIERKGGDDGERGPPYSTYQNTQTSYAPRLSYLPDVTTPGMPDYHRIAVAAEVERLARNAKEFYSARKAAANDEAATPRP